MRSRPQFRFLATELLRGGVAPKHVARTVLELQEHFDDLFDEALDAGLDEQAARRRAVRALGRRKHIAAAVLERPELKSWSARHPAVVGFTQQIASIALLPVMPVAYFACRGPLIARWGASVSLALVVTSGLLLILRVAVGPGFY